MFSVSLASLFIYHCWLVCKNRSTLGRWRTCMCVLFVDAVITVYSLCWTAARSALCICSQSAYSVVFALMMKSVSLHFSHHQSSSAQRFNVPLWAVIRRSSFSLCVHSGTLCLCVKECGLSRGVCYSVMQRHKAQGSKQLSNRHCSHMVALSQICFSWTTKTLSFRVVPLMRPFSGSRSCVVWRIDYIKTEISIFMSEWLTSSPCVLSQRLCVLQCFATASIRTVSVWAAVRTSARSLGMNLNTGRFLFFPGKVIIMGICQRQPEENYLKISIKYNIYL